MRVYLDYAAATPLDLDVAKVVDKTAQIFANPSAAYASARQAKETLEAARKSVAMFLGANSNEIVFTGGATEANNLAILGYARAHKSSKARVISVATEHASVYEPLKHLETEGFDVVWCAVDKYGQINLNELESLINEHTIFITLSLLNSEFGTVQNVSDVCKLVKKINQNRKQPIVVHTDASAAAGTTSIQVSRLGVDMLSLGGAKIYGPKSSGVLYVRRGIELQPLMFGGRQEHGRRAGTEDVAMAAGLAKALEITTESHKNDNQKYRQLYLKITRFVQKNYPKAIVNGHKKHRAFWCVSLCFEGVNGEDLVASLDAKGFEVATGAACEAGNDKPNRALMALGLGAVEAQGSLRISLGRQTTEAEIDEFLVALSDSLTTLGIIKP